MPRRQYIADLKHSQTNPLPPGIQDLRAGDDDGQFVFNFSYLQGDQLPSTPPVQISALIPDLSEYPSNHEYILFCGDDAPQHLASQLQNIEGTQRRSIATLLEFVSRKLNISAGEQNDRSQGQIAPIVISDDEDLFDDADTDDDDVMFGTAPIQPKIGKASTRSSNQAPSNISWQQRNRIRSDLRAVRDAGFRVSAQGHLFQGSSAYVTVAVRISKLGISEEAMQAWQLNPNEYVLLIVHFPSGYRTNEQLQQMGSIQPKSLYEMRVFASPNYKPTPQEAIAAFTKTSNDTSGPNRSSELHEIFISRPLIAILEETLVPVLKYRGLSMAWSFAEDWHREVQEAVPSKDMRIIPDTYFGQDDYRPALPDIVNADHYAQRDLQNYSFPLLAMQYTLRHLVRCVEFCLVCHRKVNSELEAIKPYVCDRELCLFQYMAMGFGPRIEHEIMSQPWVVDLLVSFCYSSAQNHKLKDLPKGLGMYVPVQAHYPTPAPTYGRRSPPPVDKSFVSKEYSVGYDADNREIMFHDRPESGCPVGRGSWIVLQFAGGIQGIARDLHCRVIETAFYPTIRIATPIAVSDVVIPLPNSVTSKYTAPGHKPANTITPATTPRYVQAQMKLYDQDFDSLDHTTKCNTLCRLLDVLPGVHEMQSYLQKHGSGDLQKWVDRIPPAALSLLRWIIASNRACIMQVDGTTGSSSSSYASKEERLFGMASYMQFRFAMGAPDKELRFLSEVRKTRHRLKLKYPTIFAFHGSPLPNWHMIIREGLHYKNVDHGRAYGHGIYHAKEASVSSGYAMQSAPHWPNSVLRPESAMALNEIVNAPKEFVSESPYYVVNQLEWVQTRYLLVRCNPTDQQLKPGQEKAPKVAHPQDPARTPQGISGPISIPASAIKSSHHGGRESNQVVTKKLKSLAGESIIVSSGTDDTSDETDTEDESFLVDEADPDLKSFSQTLRSASKKSSSTSKNGFEPGTLDWSTLPLMPMPTYAVSTTTRHLMLELKAMAKAMQTTPLEELGWYIDVAKIENVYQWIVELHSFHNFEVKGKPIPLAKDMRDNNVRSIVLEIRFGPDFPFSPPYVRVVRPQFLTIAQGGGGHIVMGGAMCMELLTNTGWSSVSSMEGVLMQVRLAIASEPFARLNTSSMGAADYGVVEAAEGFIRACRTHGWKEPPGFRQISAGMPAIGTRR